MHPKADMFSIEIDVRLVPEADVMLINRHVRVEESEFQGGLALRAHCESTFREGKKRRKYSEGSK